MPITSSAKKAVKVAIRRSQENQLRKVAYKSALKIARKAILASDTKASALIVSAQSTLDRAVKTKLMHRNTASRLFSRLIKSQTTNASTLSKPVKKVTTKAKSKVLKSKSKKS